jgi:hypothetical protein
MRFLVFSRTWWTPNADWPNGLEPDAGPKRKIGKARTTEEAREMCREFMHNHQFSANDKRLGLAAEFMEIQ